MATELRHDDSVSTALERLNVMLDDVDSLIARHPKFQEPAPGRPSSDEGPLLRSCVLLMYAAWEVYIEDSMIEAAGILASGDRADLPAATVEFVRAYARESDPWTLAGDGWRDTLRESVKELVRGVETDATKWGINTASPKVVNDLHFQVLGTKFLPSISWPRANSKTVSSRLARLVRIRGNIAHRGNPGERLQYSDTKKHREFVARLAKHLDDRLFDWVDDRKNTLSGA